MKKLTLTITVALMLLCSTAFATQIMLHVGAYGDDDGWTGTFNQMQFFANTTTIQYGDPDLGLIPQIGDLFTDTGDLNITSFTGLTGDDEGLGVAGSTGTAYALTGIWDDIKGEVTHSFDLGPAGYLQLTQYNSGTIDFYIDGKVNQDFGSTVWADDDSGFGLEATGKLIATLQLTGGTGSNYFDATGDFTSGSSKIHATFSSMASDFWYIDTIPPTDIWDDLHLTLGWSVNAEVDQNTDNVVTGAAQNPDELFRIGSDHDGSVEVNVPEPGTVLLLGMGLFGLGIAGYRRKKS